MTTVLVAGFGGREDALARKFESRQDPTGVVNISATDMDAGLRYAHQEKADLVVVGPEGPLVAGYVDEWRKRAPGVPIFGPSRLAAELEGSKIFMKTRCVRWDIPTAKFDFAGAYTVAEDAIRRTGYGVIKADAVCGGKGVFVTDTETQALDAARHLLARGPIVIEEGLEGYEVSYQCLVDGIHYQRLPLARDYKRLHAGSDLMTGGMGAYAPLRIDPAVVREIEECIVGPLVAAMAASGRPYHGVLYAGIMVTKEGPMLLEVNCRFGDPEAQAILPLVGDIVPYLLACTKFGGLAELPPLVQLPGAAVCVCLADKGYPRTGHRIGSVTGLGPTVAEARDDAYAKVAAYTGIHLLQYRDDIAAGV